MERLVWLVLAVLAVAAFAPLAAADDWTRGGLIPQRMSPYEYIRNLNLVYQPAADGRQDYAAIQQPIPRAILETIACQGDMTIYATFSRDRAEAVGTGWVFEESNYPPPLLDQRGISFIPQRYRVVSADGLKTDPEGAANLAREFARVIATSSYTGRCPTAQLFPTWANVEWRHDANGQGGFIRAVVVGVYLINFVPVLPPPPPCPTDPSLPAGGPCLPPAPPSPPALCPNPFAPPPFIPCPPSPPSLLPAPPFPPPAPEAPGRG